MLATLLSLVTAPPRPATRLVADTAHLSLIARTPLAAAEAEAAAAASAPLAPLAALCGLPGGTVLWVSSSGKMALLQPPGLAAEAVEVADSPPAAPRLADARPAAPGGAGGAATLRR